MSYQERRTIVSTITGIIILAAYCNYAFGKSHAGAMAAGDLKFWAGTMLVFIAIGIVAAIIIQIVFHVLMSIGLSIGAAVKAEMRGERADDREIERSIKAEMVEDEMGKLIELKSMQVGFAIAGVGFVSGLLALVLGQPPAVMLNILFISFSAGSILEGVTQIYFYRRGVRNG